MNYILIAVIVNTGVIFFMAWRGTMGALVWGLNIVLLDCYWQWLRLRQVEQNNSAKIVGKVVCGYLIRLVSLLLLLKIGQAWLTPQKFWICAAFSLVIPVTSIFSAYMLRQRGFE